jgi:hypothetical protein
MGLNHTPAPCVVSDSIIVGRKLLMVTQQTQSMSIGVSAADGLGRKRNEKARSI